ncbi:hypothetical protein GCM10007108_01680 [Thermogymnomonas acidicola]|uniref:Zinc-ribbon domain-containing protein n=1 Tax=Thermogymnomonas acidicola TaxID=399579 RepID=A0AA37BQ17_9ARCH|nr:zinc-ribbon domain-containing protein [Thermogymnomonas acidicola]GGM67247.1 hypothetical protein GCM10007108_01680 [Thermogymnomonas acidicola]
MQSSQAQPLTSLLIILSLIGGILILINAIVSLIAALVYFRVSIGVFTVNPFSTSRAALVLLGVILSVIGLAIGFMVIRQTNRVAADRLNGRLWLTITVLAVLAFIFDNGYVVGAILALIAGIVGYVISAGNFNLGWFSPERRVCLKCGAIVPSDAKFCPQCGSELQGKGGN